MKDMSQASDFIQVGVDGMSKLTSVLERIANALEVLAVTKKKEELPKRIVGRKLV